MAVATGAAYSLEDNEFLYGDDLYDDYTTPAIIARCERFSFRPDDVAICTFPRSGTALVQEIVWQIAHHRTVERGARFDCLDERSPFLELDPNYQGVGGLDCLGLLEAQREGPRIIKTHLSYSLLGRQLEAAGARVVVVMRNPKDVAVGQFHLHQALRGRSWRCSWPEFLERFMLGRTNSGDFFRKNLEWWALRDRPNVLIVRFEDLIHQRHRQLRTIAAFLGYALTDAEIDAIAHNTAFKTMSTNEKVNFVIGEDGQRFLRKGLAGDWRNTFTVAQNEALDRHIERRLAGSGLTFMYS